MKVRKLTLMAMLTAVSMIMFLVEAQIPVPIPVPGVKLGVSNVITLFALWTIGPWEAGAILLLRVFLGNLVAGSFSAMLFSLAGGGLCWVIMSLTRRFFRLNQVWILSVLGALGHNAGQLLMAIFISGTPTIAVYAPVLVLSGVVTGFFTGKCAQLVLEHMAKLRRE